MNAGAPAWHGIGHHSQRWAILAIELTVLAVNHPRVEEATVPRSHRVLYAPTRCSELLLIKHDDILTCLLSVEDDDR
jgi:hypothetical protein